MTTLLITTFKSDLLPDTERNPWAICAEKSTHSPIDMTRVLQEITSTVRPQKCMNPATSMMVAATQKMTMQAPRRLPRKTRTVRNIARREETMFWYSSLPITLSVSQLEYLCGNMSVRCSRYEGT